MRKYKITGKCPICLTGKRTYELDKKSPFCPYINCYKAKENKCCFFVNMSEKKDGVLEKLLKRVHLPPEKLAL